MIGFFFNGFFDITIAIDGSTFFITALFWPAIIVMAVIAIMASTPIRIGKKLGDKYRHVIDDMLDKTLNK